MATPKIKYHLLGDKDVIQEGDEYLLIEYGAELYRDRKTIIEKLWFPITKTNYPEMLGKQYQSKKFKKIRRRLEQ